MPLADITRSHVQAAMREFDELTREGFLEKYSAFGHKLARDYFVRESGRLYDSKVLLGAAHGYAQGRPLTRNELSGGKAATARVLRNLGFTVTQRFDWTEDEIVLACDLLARNGWKELPATRPEVVELSDLLRRLSPHPQELRSPTFRNPDGVAMKISNIFTQRDEFTGRRTNGNKWDRQVLQQFIADPEGMAAKAAAIRALVDTQEAAAPIPDIDFDVKASEGRIFERVQLLRERNPKLRSDKIRSVRAAGADVACEACSFDFARTYGPRGHEYIEVHHRTPLHVSGPTETSLQDLALLCSNCHRMIHRKRPWLTVEELQRIVTEQRLEDVVVV